MGIHKIDSQFMIQPSDVFNLCFTCVFIMHVIVLISLTCICFISNFHSPCSSSIYVDFFEKIIILRLLEKQESDESHYFSFLISSDTIQLISEHGPFDFIISNPPYILTAHLDDLDPEVKK